jgi:ATP dependent DNA ligase domain
VLIRPMLATPAPLPSAAEDRQWAYEVKWDGVRAVAYLQDGQLRLMSRTDRDVTRRYPELAPLAASVSEAAVVLDGELVSLDEEGRRSFGRLQHRMHAIDPAEIRRLLGRYPVTYMIFDLLHADGHPLLDRPYLERRTRLNQLGLTGPAWQIRSYIRPGDSPEPASSWRDRSAADPVAAAHAVCGIADVWNSSHRARRFIGHAFVVAGSGQATCWAQIDPVPAAQTGLPSQWP